MKSEKELRVGRRITSGKTTLNVQPQIHWFRLELLLYLLDWPSQSQDLNPVENMWQDLIIQFTYTVVTLPICDSVFTDIFVELDSNLLIEKLPICQFFHRAYLKYLKEMQLGKL